MDVEHTHNAIDSAKLDAPVAHVFAVLSRRRFARFSKHGADLGHAALSIIATRGHTNE